MAVLPSRAVANAASVTAVQRASANVAPVMSSDSPSAMITNSAQRSAMCRPSTSHDSVRERPRPGTRK
jgi:hypothetical protein